MTSPTDKAMQRRGPFHDEGCLAATVKGPRCQCRRGAWLDELVPRAQARAELAGQLAKWATEQRVFAESQIEAQRPDLADANASNWAAQGIRAAASMAGEVFIGVRRTALVIEDEANKRDPERPVPWPDEPAAAPPAPVPAPRPAPPVEEPAPPRPVEDLAVQGMLL